MTREVDEAMLRALELAAAAQEWGDTPIGAVVLGPDGAVLAAAANEREKRGDPTAHAEVLALRAAAQVHGDGWRLTGATLVVTLEPCTMCAGASVLARVDRVVYGADDPKAGAAGSLWDVVRQRVDLAEGGEVALGLGGPALLDRAVVGHRLGLRFAGRLRR